MSTHQPSFVQARLYGYLAGGLLVATALVPVLCNHPSVYVVLLALATVGSMVVAAMQRLSVPSANAGVSSTRPAGSDRPRLARPALEMALHLSPVALLTFVFPIASQRIATAQVGGTDLTTLLLASSLTVPWLSQAVCLPLYRAIGHLVIGGDMDQIQRRFCAVWPGAFVQTVPAIAVFALPVELVMHWSPRALGTYLGLCVLHLAFAQSLVLANVGHRRVLWAVAWASYAGALFVAPTHWYLPPLLGLVTQLVAMRRYLPQMLHPATLDRRDVAVDLVRGLLLGAVLWSDKLFFFLRSDGHFAVSTVFLALLPAILAYNYYFVRLAPGLDRSVGALRTAMENEPYNRLADRSRAWPKRSRAPSVGRPSSAPAWRSPSRSWSSCGSRVRSS